MGPRTNPRRGRGSTGAARPAAGAAGKAANSVKALQAQVDALTTKLHAAEAKLESSTEKGTPATVPNLGQMLRSPKTAYGTLIQSTSPFWVAWGGPFISKEVDFVFIDTEHTPINRHDLSALCGLYKGLGLPALVRVVDAEEARQALDGGASGVVLPYMETVDDVKALRGATKLRPFKGTRLATALRTGKVVGSEIARYIHEGGQNRALVLNIESQAAIDNLENMLAPEYEVDAVLIGPHDLSCNLGVPEQYSHPKFQHAVKTIFSKARKAGVGATIHHVGEIFGPGMQNSDAAEMIRSWGCNNIVTGGDLAFFIDGLQRAVKEIKEGAGECANATTVPVSGTA